MVQMGYTLSSEEHMPAQLVQNAQRAELVREEDVAQSAAYGLDVDKYLEKIQAGIDAGFDHIYLHQVGQDQEGFFAFAEKEILPKFQ